MTQAPTSPLLSATGLAKAFPGVRALDGVSIRCDAGRVHALIGENGAGKSTLVRILTGNQQPDAGELRLAGEPVRFADPREALAAGITAVYQELTVLPAMSIVDNVMLGQERSSRGLTGRSAEREEARAALARVGLGEVDLEAPAESLSLANQQLVEIARALVRRSRLLILDEPTAVLAGDKLQAIFDVVRSVAAQGVAILYISHRLDEVTALADDVTVLRDGREVSTGPIADYDIPRMVREMVGRDIDTVFPSPPRHGDEVVMRIRGLLPDGVPGEAAGIDLDVHAGEIVALAGLVGSGRSRLLRTVAGANPRAAGTIEVAGREVRHGVRAAVQAGVVLVPEERKTEGLVLGFAVRANATLADLPSVAPGGWLRRDLERQAFEDERKRLGIRASGPEQRTWQLS